MFQDYKDLLSAFNANDVKYLIVGGYAVSFHAQPRATKDIDLFIKADFANAKATYAALAAFGAALQDIREEDFAEAGNFIRFGREPRAIDILPAIDGVDFNDAWDRRVQGVIDPDSGPDRVLHFRGRSRSRKNRGRKTTRYCGCRGDSQSSRKVIERSLARQQGRPTGSIPMASVAAVRRNAGCTLTPP